MDDNKRLERIEQQLEVMREILDGIGKILVRSHVVTKRLGLNKDTLSQNDKVTKHEEVGHRRTFIEIGEVQVVKKRRKRK